MSSSFYLVWMFVPFLISGLVHSGDKFSESLKCDPKVVRQIMRKHIPVEKFTQRVGHDGYLNDQEMHSLIYHLTHSRNRGRFLQVAPYVRTFRGINTAIPEYVENMQQSQAMFRDWFSKWVTGDQEVDQAAWIWFLRERHRVATGDSTGNYFDALDFEYHTSEIYPGKLRTEVPGSTILLQEAPGINRHINSWLTLNQYPIRGYEKEFVQVNGLDDLLREKKRALSVPNYWPDDAEDIVAYAHSDDMDLFLDLAWERLKDVKAGIQEINIMKGKVSEAELMRMRKETLDSIADYYQATLIGHFFEKVNNSALMTEVNTWLEMMGLSPIFHGSLDLIAIRMDYAPFRQYFKDFVMRTE